MQRRAPQQIGYARCATAERGLDKQVEALQDAGCARVVVDRGDLALDERPALVAMLDDVRSGDTVTVSSLDRVGRSLRHLVETVAELQRRGVRFRSLREDIDTWSDGGVWPSARVFVGLAQFERDVGQEVYP
jgi:DNA invertase Pin-like site-specific DNA recombinase